jgi:PDZ domain/Aspartyl protease
MTSTDYWPFAIFLLFPLALTGCQDRTTEQTPLLAPQQANGTDDRPTPEAILEHFKVAADGAFLLLPVVLKGNEFLFALDTGASSGVVDSSLTPLLGEPIGTQDARTSDGVTRIPLFQSPDAKLGSLSLRTGSQVVAADLSRVREGTGEDVYGFIGMDFLGKHVFRIDRGRSEVIFLRSPGPDPGPRLPMTLQENIPYVWVQVSGMDEPQRFQVDTGASSGGGSGLMEAGTFDQLTKQGKIQPTDNALAQTLSGMSLRRRGKVAEISVAGYRHAELIFSTAPRNVLGLNYWSRYVATFDFAGGAIHLKRGSQFDQPDTQDLSGLTFVRVNGRTLVLSVEERSPAAIAGIKPHDVILKANGEKTEATSLVALRRRLGVEGTKVSLLLTRDGEEREVLLVLQAVDK